MDVVIVYWPEYCRSDVACHVAGTHGYGVCYWQYHTEAKNAHAVVDLLDPGLSLGDMDWEMHFEFMRCRSVLLSPMSPPGSGGERRLASLGLVYKPREGTCHDCQTFPTTRTLRHESIPKL
jgi:hypothetical protein